MTLSYLLSEIITGLKGAGVMEIIAALAGIASVWFSKREHILVYPVGLVNTIFYTYLSFSSHLIGEAAVNLYYTIISLWGWYLWNKKDEKHKPELRVTESTAREKGFQILFFGLLYVIIFFSLTYLKKAFAPGAIPWADALASASAFTGMYLMAKKKLESWYWWIITNIASIPLYFVKGFVVTSLYYIILLGLAIAGYLSWKKKIKVAA
ncbi:MAG: nicotinamide riboside transporter PnuC [Ferruginibacter sp.]|nr:nicotinamide riboside transporter PnuC [Ferruginibacter sp.]